MWLIEILFKGICELLLPYIGIRVRYIFLLACMIVFILSMYY